GGACLCRFDRAHPVDYRGNLPKYGPRLRDGSHSAPLAGSTASDYETSERGHNYCPILKRRGAGFGRRERMRWVRYEANGKAAYGIIEGDTVTEVQGDPFIGYEKTTTRRRLDAVKLLVPVIPKTFYAAGLNYPEHVTEAARKLGREPELPPYADIGYRANNALIAHDENNVIPKDAGELVQYEAELVAVIGRKAKHLSEQDALSCVLGWT